MMNLEMVFFIVKLVGAVLVTVGCAGIGFYKSSEILQRIEELREFQRLLLLLKSEIQYLAQPLPEALAKVAVRAKGKYRDFFSELEKILYDKQGESFAEIWSNGVRKYFSDTSLKEDDLKLLCNIGDNIGFLDKQTQLSALEMYMENLKINIQYLIQNAAARQRVCKCVGAFCGLLAVILLI